MITIYYNSAYNNSSYLTISLEETDMPSDASDLSAVRDYWEQIESHTAEGLAPHEREVYPILHERALNADSILEIGTGSGRWIDTLHEAGVDSKCMVSTSPMR